MTEKETILLVDDAPENIDLLRSIIGEKFNTKVALSGERALELCKQDPLPDLILLDVVMPGMDGFDVCMHLKSEEKTAAIPVIFLTGKSDPLSETKGLEIGAVDYIPKPISPPIVRARIDAHLERFRQKQRIEEDYAKLKNLEDLRDNLTNMIVHDMRSPLQLMSGYLELMEHTGSQKYLGKLKHSCDGLVEMVSSLLDVSRMESGEMPLERKEVDIVEITKSVVEKYQTACTGGQSITFTATMEPLQSKCDAHIVERIVANLVANGLKFSPQNESLDIVVDSLPDEIRVTVNDKGRGIPEDHQELVFEKFGQVDLRGEKHKYSSGLGLTFCKLATEAHGGRIGVDSELGKGSSFWFTIPCK